jgi:hypothetical protein
MPVVRRRPRFRLETGETLLIPEYGKVDRRLPKSVFPKSLPADYIVMPGDSLHFIAKGCYGDRELWPLIYEANRDTLSERVKRDTRKLVAGQVLHIPARPAAAPAARLLQPPQAGRSGHPGLRAGPATLSVRRMVGRVPRRPEAGLWPQSARRLAVCHPRSPRTDRSPQRRRRANRRLSARAAAHGALPARAGGVLLPQPPPGAALSLQSVRGMLPGGSPRRRPCSCCRP